MVLRVIYILMFVCRGLFGLLRGLLPVIASNGFAIFVALARGLWYGILSIIGNGCILYFVFLGCVFLGFFWGFSGGQGEQVWVVGLLVCNTWVDVGSA